MKAPLYLVNSTDGTPIPDTIFILDVPLTRMKYFDVIDVDGVSSVILGFTSEEDPESIYNNPDKFNTYTYKIGLLCSIVEQAVTENFMAVTLQVTSRIMFNTLEVNKHKDYNSLYVDTEDIIEDFLPNEEEIIEDIKNVIQLVTNNPIAFDHVLIEQIIQEEYLLPKLNIIANFVLKHEKDRLKYVQSEDNIDRFKLVLENLSSYVNSEKQEPKKELRLLRKQKRAPTPDGLKHKFNTISLPEEVKEHLQREIDKLDTLTEKSNEHSSVLDYLTWVLDIPWGVKTYNKDYPLKNLITKLDNSHYGLTQVKEHILEHMTIQRIKGGSTGTILCFAGPPGTGKTSIAKCIAEASGRQIVRVALGGLSDEAEIRGHRRTYVGSRPGRFIVGLKQAGSMDPIFVLDEIDKIGSKGDPSSALLEILDPEQNDHFIDRYLEVPVDLSSAMFICTANYEDRIPEALKDRMEFIYFKQYTKEERLIITKDYLLPKCIKDYEITDLPIYLTDEVVNYVANISQIRQIEKRLRKYLRMAAVDIVVHEKSQIVINLDYINKCSDLKPTSKKLGF